MRALVFNGPRSLRMTEMPVPTPQDHEVLVRVDAVGVCAGDLYLYLGKNPYATYPIVGGHEIAGTVAERGVGAAAVALGERVAIEPFLSCGRCYPCRVGKPNCCTQLRIVGVHRAGGFAEFVAVPADRLHRIPPGLSAEHAALGEPVAIALHACRRADVRAGERALVLGCGPIGLALIEIARERGAAVLAVDIEPARLELARALGAEPLLSGPDLAARVRALTAGEGAAVVLEATGNPRAMEQAVDLVASGGRIAIVGLVKQGVGVTFPGLDLTRKELTIVGSRASTGCFPEALQLLASGRLRALELIDCLALGAAAEAIPLLAENPASLRKAVLLPARG